MSGFDKLKPSMIVAMAYSNITFDYVQIFDTLVPDNIEYDCGKKKKKTMVKDVRAPEGSILSMRKLQELKGIPSKISNNGKKEFPNQVSLYISIGSQNAHLMVFKNCIKVSSCKTVEDVVKALILFWRKIRKHKKMYTAPKDREFIIEIVNCNRDFKLDFTINRQALNDVINSEKYKMFVDASAKAIYEPTSNTHVKVPLKLPPPEKITYTKLTLKPRKIETVYENQYSKKKKKDNNTGKFMAFRSAKVIQSVRRPEYAKQFYTLFMTIINENRDKIEEKMSKEIKSKKQ